MTAKANDTNALLRVFGTDARDLVITGDPEQTDLLPGMSGLADISRRLEVIPGIAVVQLEDKDIVRHPLVASMLTVL